MSAQDPTVSTESNASALVITASVMLGLTWISVTLRTYVRIFLTKGFLLDDWFMLAAQANFTVSCAFILQGCRHGLGRHNKSLSVSDEIESLKWQALATATYILNMWLIKMSIGIFLLRLASQRRYRYTLYTVIGIVAVWSLVLFFWNIFQCSPVEAQWDYTILAADPSARCVSVDAVVSGAYALSIMTIMSDWFFAILPIPMIWKVKMTLQAKMTVTAVLGVGIFASIATLVRLKYLSDLTEVSDILFAGTDAMVWTLIEPALAILASSLATIRPLLKAWGVKGFQTTERSRSGFRSDKQPPKMYGTGSKRGMTALGPDDVYLVNVETGDGRANHETTGFSTIPLSKSRLQSDSLAIGTIDEEEGKQFQNRGLVWSTTATVPPPPETTTMVTTMAHLRTSESSSQSQNPRPELADAGHRRIEIKRTTSIRQTTTTFNPATPSAPPPLASKYGNNTTTTNGLTVYSVEGADREDYRGDSFLSSGRESLSSIELATMQPRLDDEESPLPNSLSSARRK